MRHPDLCPNEAETVLISHPSSAEGKPLTATLLIPVCFPHARKIGAKIADGSSGYSDIYEGAYPFEKPVMCGQLKA